MANHGFESFPSEPEKDKGKDSASKKDNTGSGPQPRPQRLGGYTSLPKFEQRLFSRPLGEPIMPPSQPPKPAEHAQPPKAEDAPRLEHPDAYAEPPAYRRMKPGELAAMDAQERQAQAETLRHVQEETEKKEKKDAEDSDTTKKPVPHKREQTHPADARDIPRPPVESAAESFEDIMQRAAPELATATSGDELRDTAELSDEIPNDASSASDDEQFRRIVQQEDLADPGPATFIEQAAGEQLVTTEREEHTHAADAEFQEFIQRHPELHDLPVPPADVEGSTDETFRDIVREETGADPGEAIWHDDEPGRPPVRTPGGGPPRPPIIPPVAEGGAWHEGGNNPEPGSFGAQNVANNEAIRNAAAPAGNILAPAAVAGGIGAMEARRRLDSLRHTAREMGLAGAVGILGLGLVAEHIAAKRRDKKQQHQINKHHKEAVRTKKNLQQEQLAHRQTQQEVRRLAAEQAAAHTRFERATAPGASHAGEVAAGLAGAAVATELARKKVHEATLPPKTEVVPLSTKARRELKEQIEADPALALAVQKSRERQERAIALTTTEAVRHESRHEQRRSKRADGGGPKAGGAAPFVAPRVPQRRIPGNASAESGSVAAMTASSEVQENTKKPLLPHQWTWGIVAFILVAALLVALLR